MMWAIRIFVLVWFLCGIAGAWMEHDLDKQHWRMIARGPATLAQGVKDSNAQHPWS